MKADDNNFKKWNYISKNTFKVQTIIWNPGPVLLLDFHLQVDEAGYPDCLLQPDIASLRWVPWADENGEKVGQVECDGLYKPPSSLPLPYCPR